MYCAAFVDAPRHWCAARSLKDCWMHVAKSGGSGGTESILCGSSKRSWRRLFPHYKSHGISDWSIGSTCLPAYFLYLFMHVYALCQYIAMNIAMKGVLHKFYMRHIKSLPRLEYLLRPGFELAKARCKLEVPPFLSGKTGWRTWNMQDRIALRRWPALLSGTLCLEPSNSGGSIQILQSRHARAAPSIPATGTSRPDSTMPNTKSSRISRLALGDIHSMMAKSELLQSYISMFPTSCFFQYTHSMRGFAVTARSASHSPEFSTTRVSIFWSCSALHCPVVQLQVN